MNEYQAKNWNNFDEPLTKDEIQDIETRIAGLHFAKDSFKDDAVAMQGLYAAEALMREYRRLTDES